VNNYAARLADRALRYEVLRTLAHAREQHGRCAGLFGAHWHALEARADHASARSRVRGRVL